MTIVESIILAVILSMGAMQMGAQIDVQIKSRFLGTMVMFTVVNAVFFILGWIVALLLEGSLGNFQGMIASAILMILGVKTIMRRKQVNIPYQIDSVRELLVLAIAGGIDVLLGSLSIALLKAEFIFPALTVFFMTWFLTVRGMVIHEKRKPNGQLTVVFISGIILVVAGLVYFLDANNLIRI
ncbi:MAG: manganese efflux pump [Bacteroidales bacterium]|nr:manganese efflux pump [Bacteroidales bacterium]